jgi:hypothetical protein
MAKMTCRSKIEIGPRGLGLKAVDQIRDHEPVLKIAEQFLFYPQAVHRLRNTTPAIWKLRSASQCDHSCCWSKTVIFAGRLSNPSSVLTIFPQAGFLLRIRLIRR